MKVTILKGDEILEGIIGGVMVFFLEYVMRGKKMVLRDAMMAGFIFLGAWVCRKIAVHIYNTIMIPRGIKIRSITV